MENVVNQMDISLLDTLYQFRGSLPYPPEPILKMALFDYLQGRTSPAQWFRDAAEHDAMKWLGRGIQPARSTWYEFRNRLDKVLAEMNQRLVQQAVEEKLIHPEEGAQDGSTFRSQASRHQTFNRIRLDKRKAIVAAAVDQDSQGQLLSQPVPKWMPTTPSGRLELQQRIEVAEQKLNQMLQENAAKPKHSRRVEKNIVVSLTDPEAVFARDKEKTFCFLYNSQILVDAASLMILGYMVTNENTDVGTVGPMVDQVQKIIGGTLKTVSADAGYSSVLDLQDCVSRGINLLAPVSENSFSQPKQGAAKLYSREDFEWDPEQQIFSCPGGHELSYRTQERLARHGGRTIICRHYQCPAEHCVACPLAARCTTNPSRGRRVKRIDGQEVIDAQREKMKQLESKQIFASRGQIIERAFADAKGHRNMNKLRGRSLSCARVSIGLLVLAQNVLAVHRLRNKQQIPKNPEK